MGNGRSRYAGDFPFRCICHLPGGGKDAQQLSWTPNRQRDTWATPHRQGMKREAGMIDRDWERERDTHLLSHCLHSHRVSGSQWLESGRGQMKKDCALLLVFIGFLLLCVALSFLVTRAQQLPLQTISLLTKCTNEMSPPTAGRDDWCARTFFTLFEFFHFCTFSSEHFLHWLPPPPPPIHLATLGNTFSFHHSFVSLTHTLHLFRNVSCHSYKCHI